MKYYENGGERSIAILDVVDPVRGLVQHCETENVPRLALIDALQRCASGKGESHNEVDMIIEGIANNQDLPWFITSAYFRFRRRENSLPDGTMFTPPWLAIEVVRRLLPGLTVVDMGAGSGMLTLAAARMGFKVIAIEEDRELATILNSLARIMRLQGNIELRITNALSFSRRREGQIMANPPFTRHHLIPIVKKQELTKLAAELEIPLQMTMGYYGYFMVYAWTSKWSKRDVFLLPTNWLEARYGASLRQMLLSRCYEISLVENGNRPIFDHALTTICLLSTWPQPSVNNVCDLTPSVKVLRGPNSRTTDLEISDNDLTARLGQKLSNLEQSEQKAAHVVADVFEVKRGIATGHNEFFILSKIFAKELGIPLRELVEILRKFPSDPLNISTAYLWVPNDNPSAASLRRITEGERIGVNNRYLCENRNPWWRIKVPTPPAYFLTYMGRGRPKIIENKNGLLNLNNTHGLYIKKPVTIKLAQRIVEWLGSEEGTVALSNQARYYYGGMWKLEPRDVERTSLPSYLFSNC